jgi:hypothetical protein
MDQALAALDVRGTRRFKSGGQKQRHQLTKTPGSQNSATTATTVLVHLDTDSIGASKLLSEQLLYVAISRGRDHVRVFVKRPGRVGPLHESQRGECYWLWHPETVAKYKVGVWRRRHRERVAKCKFGVSA